MTPEILLAGAAHSSMALLQEDDSNIGIGYIHALFFFCLSFLIFLFRFSIRIFWRFLSHLFLFFRYFEVSLYFSRYRHTIIGTVWPHSPLVGT